MRAPLFALLVIAAAAVVRPVGAQTEFVTPDGTAAFIAPAGIETVTDSLSPPEKGTFTVVRTVAGKRVAVGSCVLGISMLKGAPNLETWAGLITAHRDDTENTSRAKVKAPLTFVSVGGYRDLAMRGGGDGYIVWFQQRRADGLEETRLTAVGLIRPQSLFVGECLSNKGMSFNQAEVDRIVKLVSSTRRPA